MPTTVVARQSEDWDHKCAQRDASPIDKCETREFFGFVSSLPHAIDQVLSAACRLEGDEANDTVSCLVELLHRQGFESVDVSGEALL